jgi:hypothetical protein
MPTSIGDTRRIIGAALLEVVNIKSQTLDPSGEASVALQNRICHLQLTRMSKFNTETVLSRRNERIWLDLTKMGIRDVSSSGPQILLNAAHHDQP